MIDAFLKVARCWDLFLHQFRQISLLLIFVLLFSVAGSSFPRVGQADTLTAPQELKSYPQIVWNYLKVLCDFGPRYPGSPGYENTIKLIQETGLKFANEVKTQPFYSAQLSDENDRKFLNIILKFNGLEEGPPLLIGAHYDTRPFADEETNPDLKKQPILGANDGGSGTALLLGLAQWLSVHPPTQPVHLVFFDGEDYGAKGSGQILLGSIHMASLIHGSVEEEKPRGVLILDMLGDKDLEIFQENFSQRSAPDMTKELFAIAQRNNFVQFKDKSKYTIYDDHYPFAKIGVPSAVLIDMDYPHWHKLTDTLDKCSIESLSAVFSVVTQWLETQ